MPLSNCNPVVSLKLSASIGGGVTLAKDSTFVIVRPKLGSLRFKRSIARLELCSSSWRPKISISLLGASGGCIRNSCLGSGSGIFGRGFARLVKEIKHKNM